MMTLVLFAIFVLVFLCSCLALEDTPLANARIPMALCVAGLSIIALLTHMGPNESDGRPPWLGAVLFPYEVLAISLLLLFVVRLVLAVQSFRNSAWWRRRRRRRREDRGAAQTYGRERRSNKKESDWREPRRILGGCRTETGGCDHDRNSSFLES